MPGLEVYNSVTADGTALPGAARTVQTSSDQINNPGARGIIVILDVTAITATPGLTMVIQGYDVASGKYYTVATASAAVVAISTNVYVLYAGQNVGLAASPLVLPKTFRITINVADADSATYTVGYCLVV